MGILLAGARTRHWSQTEAPSSDFFEGAGIAEALMKGLGLGDASAPITFKEISSSSSSSSSSLSFLAPGRAADVFVSGAPAGWVGVLEPSLAASWDLVDPVVADLDLGVLAAALPPAETAVEPPSKFPGSEVDLTVTACALDLLGVSRGRPSATARPPSSSPWRRRGATGDRASRTAA